MKKIKEIVVVEGKTDTATLKQLFEVDTIETNGLALNEDTIKLIKEASKTRGVIVLTDPDYPGMKIRNQVNDVIDNCQHAFVEKKDARGKKKLGIAEARKEAIIEALENVVTFSNINESITWSQFLELDIVGNKQRRLAIYQAFNLGYGNVKTLFKRLNMIGVTKQDIIDKGID